MRVIRSLGGLGNGIRIPKRRGQIVLFLPREAHSNPEEGCHQNPATLAPHWHQAVIMLAPHYETSRIQNCAK